MQIDPDLFEAKAASTADLLKALANQKRLMVLCKLTTLGTATPGELAIATGLSQSALSQHLAVMRDEGILTFVRDGQTLWYRMADARIETLLGTLYSLYCAPEAPDTQG
jgi:ArsR family transcriptional regulator, virulence genes transcriptional regulator